MTDSLNKILIFAAGAAIGSAVTWKLLKTKYERIAQEEIDSVKAVFSRNKNDDESEEFHYEHTTEPVADVLEIVESDDGIKIAVPKVNLDIRDYTKTINENGYRDYSNAERPTIIKNKEVADMERKYVIEPEEFDEAGYDTRTLYYRSDGTLEDCYDNNLGYAKDFFGIDPEEHFGEYEDDSVFIRDQENHIDYEILRTEDE